MKSKQNHNKSQISNKNINLWIVTSYPKLLEKATSEKSNWPCISLHDNMLQSKSYKKILSSKTLILLESLENLKS